MSQRKHRAVESLTADDGNAETDIFHTCDSSPVETFYTCDSSPVGNGERFGDSNGHAEYCKSDDSITLNHRAVPSDSENPTTTKLAAPAVVTDTGYAWVIVCASFINCYIVGMTFIGFSIMYVEITEHFESTRAATGWIGSLYLACGNILGIFASIFVGRFGCRMVCIVGGFTWCIGFGLSSLAPDVVTLYFTYGIIAGVGFNIVTLTSFVIVQQHFVKFRAVAAGVAASGVSLGSLSAGPLLGALLNTYQWRGTLLMMSAIVLQSCVLGALYRPPEPLSRSRKRASLKTGAETKTLVEMLRKLCADFTDFTLFKNAPFTLTCVGTFLTNIGLTMFFQHTPSRAVVLGIDRASAYLLPTVTGITMFISRIFGAVIGNLPCTNRLLQYGLCITLAGGLHVLLGSQVTFLSIALVGACIGFLVGCFLTIQTTVMSDLVGVANVARAQGFLFLFMGFGALISVPLAGFIFDKTDSYNIPFYVGGVLEFIGGLFVVAAIILRCRNKASEQQQQL